jgi:hypothetical protein
VKQWLGRLITQYVFVTEHPSFEVGVAVERHK